MIPRTIAWTAVALAVIVSAWVTATAAPSDIVQRKQDAIATALQKQGKDPVSLVLKDSVTRADSIVSAELDNSDKGAVLILSTDGHPVYHWFSVDDKRLVIDFYNAVYLESGKSLEPDHKGVMKSIRSSMYSLEPVFVSRFVADTSEPAIPIFTLSSDRIEIAFRPFSASGKKSSTAREIAISNDLLGQQEHFALAQKARFTEILARTKTTTTDAGNAVSALLKDREGDEKTFWGKADKSIGNTAKRVTKLRMKLDDLKSKIGKGEGSAAQRDSLKALQREIAKGGDADSATFAQLGDHLLSQTRDFEKKLAKLTKTDSLKEAETEAPEAMQVADARTESTEAASEMPTATNNQAPEKLQPNAKPGNDALQRLADQLAHLRDESEKRGRVEKMPVPNSEITEAADEKSLSPSGAVESDLAPAIEKPIPAIAPAALVESAKVSNSESSQVKSTMAGAAKPNGTETKATKRPPAVEKPNPALALSYVKFASAALGDDTPVVAAKADVPVETIVETKAEKPLETVSSEPVNLTPEPAPVLAATIAHETAAADATEDRNQALERIQQYLVQMAADAAREQAAKLKVPGQEKTETVAADKPNVLAATETETAKTQDSPDTSARESVLKPIVLAKSQEASPNPAPATAPKADEPAKVENVEAGPVMVVAAEMKLAAEASPEPVATETIDDKKPAAKDASNAEPKPAENPNVQKPFADLKKALDEQSAAAQKAQDNTSPKPAAPAIPEAESIGKQAPHTGTIQAPTGKPIQVNAVKSESIKPKHDKDKDDEVVPGPGGMDQIVSIDFREMDLSQVVALLAKKAGINVIAGNEVTGTVTADIRNVPLRKAMDMVLRMNNLGIVEEEGVYRIVTYEQAVAARRATRMVALNNAQVEDVKKTLDGVLMGSPEATLVAISANVATNVLIVSGPQDRIDSLVKLATDLDIKKPQLPTVTEAIKLNYIEPKDAKPIVTTMLTKETGKAEVDEAGRHIIVTDMPVVVEQIRDVLAGVDKPVKQVSIEAMIIDAVLRDGSQTGAKWLLEAIRKHSTNGDLISDLSQLSLGGNLGSIGTDGLDAGILSVGLLSAEARLTSTIAAEVQSRNAKILANPSIVTVENQPAHIDIVQEFPYQEITQGLTGPPVASTSFKPIGVTLEVTPRVTHTNDTIVEIDAKESSVSGTTDTGVPIEDKRQAKTTLRVEDGKTIFIGGLRNISDTNVVSKIPVLGDIPVLNFAFRQRNLEKINTELLIFMTCHVLPDVLAPLTDEQQKEYGKIESVPAVPDSQRAMFRDIVKPQEMRDPIWKWRRSK